MIPNIFKFNKWYYELLIVSFFYFGLVLTASSLIISKINNKPFYFLERLIIYSILGALFHVYGEYSGLNEWYVNQNKGKDLNNLVSMAYETVLVGFAYGIFGIFGELLLNQLYSKNIFNGNEQIQLFLLNSLWTSLLHVFGEYNGINQWYYETHFEAIPRPQNQNL